jgi:amino acid transporter
MGAGKWLSAFGAYAGVALLAVLTLSGGALALQHGPATDFAHVSYAPRPTADFAILWGAMVFAFGGPEALAFLRNDVEGGIRQILKVLVIVALLLTIAYLVGTTAILSILGPGETTRLSGLPDAVILSLTRLGFGGLAPLVLALVGVSMLGGYSSWFGVAARLPFAAGVDDFLPKAFALKDKRTGAPIVSILFQSAAVIVFVLLSQSGGAGLKAAYDFLVAMSVLSYTMPFAFLFVIYIVAQKKPAPADAWTPPGGKRVSLAIGWTGLLVAMSAILCTLVPSPDEPDKIGSVVKLVLASFVLLAAGAAFYAAARQRAKA